MHYKTIGLFTAVLGIACSNDSFDVAPLDAGAMQDASGLHDSSSDVSTASDVFVDADSPAEDAAAPHDTGSDADSMSLGREHETGVYALDVAQLARGLAEGGTGARVIGLGELNHNNREMIETSAALQIELIREHGVRLVLWEDRWAQAEWTLDGAIVRCEDLEPEVLPQVFTNAFSARRHDSALPVVEFICAWNRAHPDDRVEIHGIDGRGGIYTSTHPLRAHAIRWEEAIQEEVSARNADEGRAADAEPLTFNPDDFYRCLNNGRAESRGEFWDRRREEDWAEGYTSESRAVCLNAIELTETVFARAESEEARLELERHAANIRQHESEFAYFFLDGEVSLAEFRDLRANTMFFLARSYIDQLPEGARALIDASFLHTIKNSPGVTNAATDSINYGYRNLGRQLSSAYGSTYRNVVIAASQFVFETRDGVEQVDVRMQDYVDVDLQVRYGGPTLIDTAAATGVGLPFGFAGDVRAFLMESVPTEQNDYIITLPITTFEDTLPRSSGLTTP